MAKKQVVRITCDVKDRLSLDDLTPLQQDLKWLEEKQYEKLKASLLRHGFVFPEYVWRNGKTNYVCDGHQRIRALYKMRDDDGIEVEGGKLPVVFVKAKNKKHAMELILAATSQYGKLDEDSVYRFVSENDLEWEDAIKGFADFPSMNMGTLEYGWFKEAEIADPKNEWQNMPEYEHEDQRAVRRIIVNFSNDEDVAKFAECIGQQISDATKYIWFPEQKKLRKLDREYK